MRYLMIVLAVVFVAGCCGMKKHSCKVGCTKPCCAMKHADAAAESTTTTTTTVETK